MIIVWNLRSMPLSTSICLFPLRSHFWTQSFPSGLSLISTPLPATDWASITLLCSLWLEASKDGYHSSLCSFWATHHTHPVAQYVCGAGAEWAAVAHFSHFFSPGLKGLFLSQCRQTVSTSHRPSCRRNAVSWMSKWLTFYWNALCKWHN